MGFKMENHMESKKQKYAPKSWKEYNRSLVNRGNISLWISEDSVKKWYSKRTPGILGGRKEVFSDDAILCLMFLKSLFRMPYRMVEGFGNSLMVLLGLDLQIPHFTRICKRSKKLKLPSLPENKDVTIILDGSGMKIYGEGEWKEEVHGKGKKKKWKKIHIALDPKTQEVILTDVSEKEVHDSKLCTVLLNRFKGKIEKVIGDGAYDTKECYQAIVARGAEPIIPPRKGARLWPTNEKWAKYRNNAIKELLGLKDQLLWKKMKGYTIRSLVETFFSRMKRSFGDRAYSKTDQGLEIENWIKCLILNKFANLGLPQAQPV